ncbi:hypothetical protein DFAR_1260036 [Desulfarculales bacterium]
MDTASFSKAVLTKLIRKQVLEIAQDRKKKPVIIIDGASLLRRQVLAELHSITQFQGDFEPILPISLAGQNNFANLLIYRIFLPLASRVIARNQLVGVSLQDMQAYLLHHLKIAGVNQNLLSDPAVTTIQQGSGGLFRRANHLARGADHGYRRGVDSGRLPGARPHRRSRIDLIKCERKNQSKIIRKNSSN